MELIGVVPSVDMIEKATPIDIINNPTVNEQILLSILLMYIFQQLYPFGKIAYKNDMAKHN